MVSNLGSALVKTAVAAGFPSAAYHSTLDATCLGAVLIHITADRRLISVAAAYRDAVRARSILAILPNALVDKALFYVSRTIGVQLIYRWTITNHTCRPNHAVNRNLRHTDYSTTTSVYWPSGPAVCTWRCCRSPTDPESVPTSPSFPARGSGYCHGRAADSYDKVALRYTAPGSATRNDIQLHGLSHGVLEVFAPHLTSVTPDR